MKIMITFMAIISLIGILLTSGCFDTSPQLRIDDSRKDYVFSGLSGYKYMTEDTILTVTLSVKDLDSIILLTSGRIKDLEKQKTDEMVQIDKKYHELLSKLYDERTYAKSIASRNMEESNAMWKGFVHDLNLKIARFGKTIASRAEKNLEEN